MYIIVNDKCSLGYITDNGSSFILAMLICITLQDAWVEQFTELGEVEIKCKHNIITDT